MNQLDNIQAAKTAIMAGNVGVIPTDTVYGLVAMARDTQAVSRLYALKSREKKPGTIIAGDVAQLEELGVSGSLLTRVKHLWPNPISIVLAVGPELRYIHQGLDSFPARIPADEGLRALLLETGPLVTSSANQPGEPPAVDMMSAQAYFGDMVDFYVDGGNLAGKPPSTIITLQPDGYEIVRQGAFEITDELL
jgi:L-threonylcarbamoyladenylate synthase